MPIPPAKFFIAIGKSPRPIHATIVPDTAGVNINRIFLRPKPIIIITIPAIIWEPNNTGSPYLLATDTPAPINIAVAPIITGIPPPNLKPLNKGIGYNCNKVDSPAKTNAAWINNVDILWLSPAAFAINIAGKQLPITIAIKCCNPKGIASFSGGIPSNSNFDVLFAFIIKTPVT